MAEYEEEDEIEVIDEEELEMTEEELQFKNNVTNWRSAKVDLDTAAKKEKKLKSELKSYIENNEDYREEYYEMMKLTRTFNFLSKDNISLAKKKDIKVKYSTTYTLNLSRSRIKDLIKEGVIKRDEITVNRIPDLEKLEEDFKKKKITGLYTQGLRIGLKK